MPSHDRHRRRSTQISPAETNRVQSLLSRAFSGEIPESQTHNSGIDRAKEEALYSSSSSSTSSLSDSETARKQYKTPSFFPSAIGTTRQSYSRAMHAYHTTSQPGFPSDINNTKNPSMEKENQNQNQTEKGKGAPEETPTILLPNYTQTMHAFTLNQLNHMDNTGSHNPASNKNSNKPINTKAFKENDTKPTPPTLEANLTPTSSPLLKPSTPLALKLTPSQSRTQYLSRSLSILNQMSLDEEPRGPSNTPVVGSITLLAAAKAAKPPMSDVDVDVEMLASPTTTTMTMTMAMSMSSAEMLAQGRELEARFEELIMMGGAGAADGWW